MKSLVREIAEFIQKDIATAEQRVMEYKQQIRDFNTGKAAGEWRDDYHDVSHISKDLPLLEDRIKKGEVLLEEFRTRIKADK